MHDSLVMPPPHQLASRYRLVLLTLLVLLAHGLLLGGLSTALIPGQGKPDPAVPPIEALRFVTRTITPQPRAVAPPTPIPRPRPVSKAAIAVAATAQSAPAAEPLAAAPVAASATPASSPDRVASAEAASPANPVTDATAATPAAPPQPAPSSQAQSASKPLPPEPVRMLFDGRGEERGFIKYAASAELLWLPVGDQYSAKLEISAWGIRVRTWTSKGALGESGLMPTRFGDKPRGAELATHFQRDKGIISFSANNPDVPLQQGAQDKLSALLQLSALVAGEPERYGPGTTVRFQAADAHNAESWVFQVGAMEPLELPGGALKGLKFSKEPSLEFDQRIEVWLAPEAHYLPVRLRITEANGAYADLLWRNTQKPD